MLLRVGNAWAEVRNASAEETAFLRAYLTYTRTAFSGPSESTSLLRPDGLFPAGLADMAISALRARGTTVQRLLRASTPPFVPPEKVDLSGLWDHQRDAVLLVLSGAFRGVIQHATGTGKGTTIATLCRLAVCRVLVVVPSKQLMREMHARLAKHGVKAGRLGDGFRETKLRVLVCIAASLKVLTKTDLESFGAVMVDEVHGAPSVTTYEPLMKCLNAQVRLGFSGTPMDRADKKSLYIVGVLGPVIHRFTPQAAAKREITARCQLRMPSVLHPIHKTTGRYDQWEHRAYAFNKARNLLVCRLVSGSEGPRIVFVRTKAHQKMLAKMLGVDCLTVNDETPGPEVLRILKAFREGAVGTLVSTPIFRQGVDIPEVATVINAAGGKATIDVIQKVGRGSRRFQADGSVKETFRVYDIDDRGCGCPGIHQSCKWLEAHTEARKAAYLKYGYVVLPTE